MSVFSLSFPGPAFSSRCSPKTKSVDFLSETLKLSSSFSFFPTYFALSLHPCLLTVLCLTDNGMSGKRLYVLIIRCIFPNSYNFGAKNLYTPFSNRFSCESERACVLYNWFIVRRKTKSRSVSLYCKEVYLVEEIFEIVLRFKVFQE